MARRGGDEPPARRALAANDPALTEDTPAWRRLCRLALVVAARAHAINARREWGDYGDSWPQSAGVPSSELPGRPEPGSSGSGPPGAGSSTLAIAEATPISESFAAFTPTPTNWSLGYQKQARRAMFLFISLMGDLPVNRITGDIAGTFRDRLQAMPAKHGTGIYAGMSPSQASTTLVQLKEAMKTQGGTVQIGNRSLTREQAIKLSKHLSMKTVNKKRLVGADTLIDQMVGHEPGSVGAKHYTDPLPIRTKADAIAKIDYEIDLSLVLAALRGNRRFAAE